MNMNDIIKLIDQQIQWCADNPEYRDITKSYHQGFINGLDEAKYLIWKLNESKNEEDILYIDEPQNEI